MTLAPDHSSEPLPTAGLAVRVAAFCYRFAAVVILIALMLAALTGLYTVRHFAIDTDIAKLIDPTVGWRQREAAFARAFPQNDDLLVAVIDAKTPDLANEAAMRLAAQLEKNHDLFKSVRVPEGSDFFRQNGLLFLSAADLRALSEKMIASQGMLASLAADPTVHGLFTALDLGFQGALAKAIDPAMLKQPLAAITKAIDSLGTPHPTPLSWQKMLDNGTGAEPRPRRFLLLQPALDYSALEPGAAASDAVRQSFRDLGYTDPDLVKLRLTGPVALDDEEFASVAQGSGLATGLSLVLVSLCLFMALGSWRLIAPILVTLLTGLAATSAFALALYGSLNLISIAFAVMFIGIAVDFGIQYGVRYRAERHRSPSSEAALAQTAARITRPIVLAALATATGFLAFTPTAYVGVSELGVIAGFGMLLAAALNLTLLPALLRLFRPKAEPAEIGFTALLPLNTWLLSHRRLVLAVACLLALAAAALAVQLRFDFDPLHLKDPHSESVSTLYDLMQDPQESPYSVDILAPSLDAAQALAQKLATLPAVDSALTLASFIPDDQEEKLSIIGDMSMLMGPALTGPAAQPTAPAEAATRAVLDKTLADARALAAATNDADIAAFAQSLARATTPGDAAQLNALEDILLRHWPEQLAQIRDMFKAAPVTLSTLPADLKQEWMTPDAQARISVVPKGDMTQPQNLRGFTDAVRALAPEATGSAISIQESAKTVVTAFVEAGIIAVIAICLLLWFAFKRLADALRLLAPLVLASLLTAATCVLLGWPITYANIIALPLFLGLGVSFAIYFVLAWRNGTQSLLSAAVTRAVMFSATTTMVAFGSLSLSQHPGTHQMGLLLATALCYALVTILVFLPPLLGPPPSETL